MHQTAHMHGDTALNRSKVILVIIAKQVLSGLALPGRNIMAADQSKFHCKCIEQINPEVRYPL